MADKKHQSIAQMIAGSAARLADKRAGKSKKAYTEADHDMQMAKRKPKVQSASERQASEAKKSAARQKNLRRASSHGGSHGGSHGSSHGY